MPVLTAADLEGFYQKGYVVIPAAFSKEAAKEHELACFKRLGADPEDRSTWTGLDRVHMGGDQRVNVSEFAPKVYEAILELLGGEERVTQPIQWSDHYIVNLGERADQPWLPPGPNTPGWHKDGDFFRHFLDSPEQGLLVFVNWTDVVHQGGPTYVATDSVPVVARYLAERPQGVRPEEFSFRDLVNECKQFEEMTAEAGDVVLLHPFTLHAGSQNMLRVKRIITNPPVSLREPMRFDRPDGNYSPVERAVLKALGKESLAFAPKGEREHIVPERVKRQRELEAQLKAKSVSQ